MSLELSKDLLNSEISDVFLKDYFRQFFYGKLELLHEGITAGFVVTRGVGGALLSTDWKDTYQIYLDAIDLVNNNLFDVGDHKGFPKAIKFVAKYMPDELGFSNNTNDIILHYLRRQLIIG